MNANIVCIFCKSVLMLLLLAALTFYVLKHKRRQYFEMKILISMALSYGILFLLFGSKLTSFVIGEFSFQILHAIQIVLRCFLHWSFTSQYIMTCILLPNLVKKAYLLMYEHQSFISNDLEVTTIESDFIQRHQELDIAIKQEKL